MIPYPPDVRALVADPAWPFEDSLPGGGRGAAKHYDLMTIEEIKAFPMPTFHPDGAFLFLWRVASMQQEALDVMAAWGFSPVKSEIVWVKTTQYDKIAFGMGRIVRNAHEVCLIGARGRPRPLVRNVRSVFMAPVGRHSQKPDEFYDIVRTLTAEPRVEIFARQVQPGFYAHGRELD